MKKTILPTVNRSRFWTHLKNREFEDIPAIRMVENYLTKKRGYIFKMPRPGSSVILLVSGGLDSITAWNILMEECGLRVYPLTLEKGGRRRSKEKEAVKYFSHYFKKKYPELYVKPMGLDVMLEDFIIPIEEVNNYLHPQALLEVMNAKGEITTNLSLGSFTLSPILGKLFSQYLYLTQHVQIRTILCAVTAYDAYVVPEQSFTSMRSSMLSLCLTTGDERWQFSSVLFEKELGVYMNKSDVVSWGHVHGLPQEKTWSCYRAGIYHCGNKCLTCIDRRRAFYEAGVEDPTPYLCNFRTIRSLIKSLIFSKRVREG